MTEKKLSTLVINQVESIDVYNLLKAQGKINQDELYLISGEADAITGIKGNKETTYRTGNVNLTPADIGALPDDTVIPTVPTKISAFENDAGYLTLHQSLANYPKKSELAKVATSGDYTDLINTPTIPSTEGLATETYVLTKIAEVVNSAPGALDTLNELAQALGNDPNFATTMATELGKKANSADLAKVATSGSYNDLSNKPTIPSKVSLLENDKNYLTSHQDISGKVDKVTGKGLSTNDLTDTLKSNYDAAYTHSQSVHAPSNAERNTIVGILENGSDLTVDSSTRKVNITVPTKVSELTDDVVNGNYLPLTGGTMTGDININNKTITNLKTPTADTEAANKKYVDDLIAANDHIVNRFTFTATAGQSTFTIPFDFEDSSALTVYYNGIMMKETDNYTISGKVITLVDFTAEAGDYLTVMGIEGASAIDFGSEAADAIAQMNTAKTEAINSITTIKDQAIAAVDDKIASLPLDTSQIMYKNQAITMTADGKITMDTNYSPATDDDVATKKYVDNHVPDVDPPVGTTTDFAIYIGSTAPASGTTPLLWIDTTSSTGTFKYRTSTTGTWTPVPVAWS